MTAGVQTSRRPARTALILSMAAPDGGGYSAEGHFRQAEMPPINEPLGLTGGNGWAVFSPWEFSNPLTERRERSATARGMEPELKRRSRTMARFKRRGVLK